MSNEKPDAIIEKLRKKEDQEIGDFLKNSEDHDSVINLLNSENAKTIDPDTLNKIAVEGSHLCIFGPTVAILENSAIANKITVDSVNEILFRAIHQYEPTPSFEKKYMVIPAIKTMLESEQAENIGLDEVISIVNEGKEDYLKYNTGSTEGYDKIKELIQGKINERKSQLPSPSCDTLELEGDFSKERQIG